MKCHSVSVSAIVDGLCETCRSKVGETSIDASVPLLNPPITVDLHARPVVDDPHLLPTVKSDESIPNAGTRPRVYTPDPIPGVQLLDIIGTGGSATVFRGRQLGTDRECAVKFVNRTTHASAGDRLGREVRAIALLDHPNIIRVFSCDLDGPSPYLVMELAAGGSLADRLKANPNGLPIEESVALVERVSRAIHHAHENGIVHRDIKPGNLLLDSAGTVKVSDFGLARNFEKDATITKSQAILGTPAYMAPEQARSEEATPISDVYGIGAVLYDCLTGRPPFPTRDYVETLTHVKNDPPPAPRSIRKAIPRELEAICLKCLEKDPAKRYVSANNLADDLTRFQKGERTKTRPVSLPVAIGRKAHKHSRVLTTAAVILIAIFTASAVWPEKTKRKQTQPEITNSLMKGRPVTLVTDWDIQVDKFELLQSAEFPRLNDIKEWTAYAYDPAGIGLILRPGVDSYLITGELCQSKRASENNPELAVKKPLEMVGLMIGHESITSGNKTIHYYELLHFSDFLKADNQVMNLVNRMHLNTYCFEQNLLDTGGFERRGGSAIKLPPPIQYPSWRQFTVKVSPQGITSDFDNQTMILSAEEINANRKDLQTSILKNLPPGHSDFQPKPWNPKEMSIGLWVKLSCLSVRNLVITPNP
jgi:serine/threonine protein kinase